MIQFHWDFAKKKKWKCCNIMKSWGRIYFGGPRKSDIAIINAHDP